MPRGHVRVAARAAELGLEAHLHARDRIALAIDRAGFTRLMDDFPSVRHDLLNALTQRVRASIDDPETC